MAPRTETTTVPRKLTRTATHRARTVAVDRLFETTARRVAALDRGLLGTVLLTALFAAYVAAVVPATLALLFGGFGLAVAAITALPFAAARTVSAALTRNE